LVYGENGNVQQSLPHVGGEWGAAGSSFEDLAVHAALVFTSTSTSVCRAGAVLATSLATRQDGAAAAEEKLEMVTYGAIWLLRFHTRIIHCWPNIVSAFAVV
jgi:hypothetical protein